MKPFQPINVSGDLKLVWLLAFGSLILAFPFYSLAVFGGDYDRKATADIFAIHVTIAYWLGMLAAFLPLPGLRKLNWFQRLHWVCLAFMLASYLTHLSWELLWLIFHKAIAHARDSLWAYPWWAYIDGGDLRYYQPKPDFLMIETISVINGCIGLSGLWLLKRSRYNDFRGTLLCMSTAVTHTILTWYYYGTEILAGLANVNSASFIDLWIKFVLLNAPWLIFPWLVLAWGNKLLLMQLRDHTKMETLS